MRVCFLPDAAGDGRFWHPLGRLLPADWENVFFDWPGLGVVPPWAEVQGFDDLARLVLPALDGPTGLVAQSMGGVTSGGLDTARFGARDWRQDHVRGVPHAPRWIRRAASRPHGRPPGTCCGTSLDSPGRLQYF